MPLTALNELPLLIGLKSAWRRLVEPKPVLIAFNDTTLVCCWAQGDHWQQRVVKWPEGVCRDGVPLQREAVGEFIADLIFDCDVPGAELVICLPLNAVSWCVVDGYASHRGLDQLPQFLQSVDLPFDLAESYVTSSPVQDSLAVVGVPRSLIQGWSEVVQLADFPLRRVDWSLTAAQRALQQLTQAWDGDLAWLVAEGNHFRLVLFRQRVPEVDHFITKGERSACQSEVRALVSAWRARDTTSSELGWWLSAKPEHFDDWLTLVDGSAGETCLNEPLPSLAEPWDQEEDVLSSLQHLALLALQKEER